MRYIERDMTLAPAYLTAPDTVDAVNALGAFLESGGVSAKQGYLEADAAQILRQGAKELVQACMDQFNGKCAFTEMPIESPEDALHLFRPGQGARFERGRKSQDKHYWWLVNEWSNLYLATPEVSSLNGSCGSATMARCSPTSTEVLLYRTPQLLTCQVTRASLRRLNSLLSGRA